MCLSVCRTTCLGSSPAAFTDRTNALRTSTVWPCRASGEGKSQGVSSDKVAVYSARKPARSADIGWVRGPLLALGTRSSSHRGQRARGGYGLSPRAATSLANAQCRRRGGFACGSRAHARRRAASVTSPEIPKEGSFRPARSRLPPSARCREFNSNHAKVASTFAIQMTSICYVDILTRRDAVQQGS